MRHEEEPGAPPAVDEVEAGLDAGALRVCVFQRSLFLSFFELYFIFYLHPWAMATTMTVFVTMAMTMAMTRVLMIPVRRDCGIYSSCYNFSVWRGPTYQKKGQPPHGCCRFFPNVSGFSFIVYKSHTIVY